MPKELEYVISGYKKFRQKYFENNNQLYEELKDGQKPKMLVVGCSDSRVDPAIVLNCKPGDLFVVRNVANLVPPFENDSGHHGTSAALEFGVLGLGIRHIIVFGHSGCGGIQALVTNPKSLSGQNFVSRWMEIASDAHTHTVDNHGHLPIDQQIENCAHLALINSLNNLFTFPWIKERVEGGQLFLHAWYFNIDTGIIEKFDAEQQKFIELNQDL